MCAMMMIWMARAMTTTVIIAYILKRKFVASLIFRVLIATKFPRIYFASSFCLPKQSREPEVCSPGGPRIRPPRPTVATHLSDDSRDSSPSNLDRNSDGSSVVLFCCGLIGSVSFSHSYEIETLFPNHLYVTALHPYRVKASC